MSDGLEFACWDDEIIRTAFIIDAFDREIIYVNRALTAGDRQCGWQRGHAVKFTPLSGISLWRATAVARRPLFSS
ncbi:hypothetical protein [Mesorhizobium sp.]|uniref:hypothetical protein n=1 Tax=Mesorhizobium sp. TaxID=1871066 RepID=UPI0025D67FAB|nr:hypothetical protein [Mesorhizobium sp.]